MDFANKGNRQTQQSAPQGNAMGPQSSKFSNVKSSTMDMNKAGALFILIATSILVLALILGLVFFKKDSVNKESALIETNQYQAVFLDSQDGQVYFGRLGVYNDDTYVLTDIYYVRVENPIQPDGGQAQQANISLAKLGNELHAPKDFMYINKSQVLYWENLSSEGQVVTAITNYKENGEQSTNEAPQSTQPAGAAQQDDTPPAIETPTTPTP